MPEVQIANYTRPGIYSVEFDNSVTDTPIIEGLQNLVLGFSKKGPVNTPITISSIADLEAIYGVIDRRLERKGSYFHRTIEKVLESNPVTAINLLLTDDNLDTIEYQSFSTSTKYVNDVKRTGPYSRFFDRSGFWKRSTETFVSLVDEDINSSQRILNFTNMSDGPITVFIFKSTVNGFDVDMITWFGNPDNIPTYVYPTDYVSDYMVDVYVVSGDWTNYDSLSVDSRWGNYFNTNGLVKTQVNNFVNDSATPTLATYQGLSLIPYFRDADNRNVFIETIINNDTDRTGLFCGFDIDKLEDTDYPTGLIDLVGNNIAGDPSIESVDFLSYKEIITDNITYNKVELDTPGNVLSFGATYKNTALDRSGVYAEEYVNGVICDTVDMPSPIQIPTLSITFSVADGAYAVIGGEELILNDTGSASNIVFEIDAANYVDPVDSSGTLYTSTFVIDTTGSLKAYNSNVPNTKPTVSATDVVLAYVDFQVYNDGTSNTIRDVDVVYVSVDNAGFVELQDSIDFNVTSDGSGNITWEFIDTANPATSDYLEYRRLKYFNLLITYLNGVNGFKATMLDDNGDKNGLENMNITNVISSTVANKEFTLETNLDESILTLALTGESCFYILDNEMIVGTDGMLTKNTPNTTTEGVVGKYSTFYENFRDGGIATGDYFNENLAGEVYDITFMDDNGTDYIVFEGDNIISFPTNTKLKFPDSELNTGVFTIVDPNDASTSLGLTGAGFTTWAYEVAENTVAETITSDKVWDENNKHYLRMYFNASGILSVTFMDSLLQAVNPIVDLTKNETIIVVSQKTNYKQTIEIEVPSGYVQQPNKILIDGSRYTELKVGDYLSADVDTSSLEADQVPKYITRILSKRVYVNDATLIEVTCDAAILKNNYNGDLQTTSFTKIDDYITEYKGFSMNGFKVRQASMPDGTEERQEEILNLVAKGTCMFDAITNKDTYSFRYLVDSFGLGLAENSKQQYVDICGTRLDCLGLINMPSIKDFRNSTSPSFTNPDGTINTEYIAQGGDPESNPAFLYSFGDGPGVSSVGYFTPYVTVNDNGRPLNVPPAAWVAEAYLRKFNNVQTNITPWTVVAGVINGQINGIAGLEFEYNGNDISNLNGMQANPIVSKKNRGFVIETENTAQTFVKSALSAIHAREVLIELEDELRDMLLTFQWKFNTPDVRAEIKLRADLICEKYVNQNGLNGYFNKCDSENNPPEIVDAQMGVLDTYVEITRAMSIIVNNITILKTGAINSGGFL